MQEVKVSLICTTKNEEGSIREFLDSLLSQSRPPNEIIITDGGSTDRTVEIIKSYVKKGFPIKLIIKKGSNIAQARNFAIENAKYEIIASTDAGCRIDKNWLENLIRPFKKDSSVDVVAGWYKADANTAFEKCVANLTCHRLEKVLKNPDQFLPSSRSIAFKKSAWKKVGGYPEWLTRTAEDTLFDLNLKKAGYEFTFASKAIVYWKQRKNLKEFLKQIYLYSRGDREAGIFKKRYALLFLFYLSIFLSFILGFFLKIKLFYLFGIGIFVLYFLRNYLKFQNKNYPLFINIKSAIIRFFMDFAKIVGYLKTKEIKK